MLNLKTTGNKNGTYAVTLGRDSRQTCEQTVYKLDGGIP